MIASEENLVFTRASVNRSLGDKDIFKYLEEKGTINSDNPNLIDLEINGKIYTVNRKDIEEVYEIADKKRLSNRLDAVTEVGVTVAKTGAYMAAQQIVGLILVETIDIFVDEIKDMTTNGKIINSDGWLQNTKDMANRIQNKLAARFEEREIWARAKAVGVESGVAGALSVIPQIIVSIMVKVPSLVLAIIRESVLSTIRCVRILVSNDENKFDSIKIILAGAASAIVSIYVSRVIGSAITGVPLLNKFNRQVTDVLVALLVTAIPLSAIYVFEKNKNMLNFAISKIIKN